jgi:hypothetical protein
MMLLMSEDEIGEIRDELEYKKQLDSLKQDFEVIAVLAKDAGVNTYELVTTGDHPWAKLVSIPALVRDYQITDYSFTIEMTGAGVARGPVAARISKTCCSERYKGPELKEDADAELAAA